MAFILAEETLIVKSPGREQNKHKQKTLFTFGKQIFKGRFEFTCTHAYVHEHNLIISFFDGQNYEDVFTFPLEEKYKEQIIKIISGLENDNANVKYKKIAKGVKIPSDDKKKHILFQQKSNGLFRAIVQDNELKVNEMRIERNYLFLGTNKIYTGKELDSALKLFGVLNYHIDIENKSDDEFEKSASESWERGVLYDAACTNTAMFYKLSECTYFISGPVKEKLCAKKENDVGWKEKYNEVKKNAETALNKQEEKNAQIRTYATETDKAADQIMVVSNNIKNEIKNDSDQAKKSANEIKELANLIGDIADKMEKLTEHTETKKRHIRRRKFVKRRH
jgi:hypothetical protein